MDRRAGYVELSNGVQMPLVGLGTWDQGPSVGAAVTAALNAGYRAIDTASFYQNEAEIGRAVAGSGVPRGDIFITTKVWNSEHGFDETLRSFEVSNELLGLEYVDLYLIHWPIEGRSGDTWRALERLYSEKRVRAIGVSNFEISHLIALAKTAQIAPMVNQLDIHPRKLHAELRDYCQQRNIVVQAWSPLGQGDVFHNAVLKRIAAQRGRTIAQVVLRWHLQHGVAVIPKSSDERRIVENLELFDFELSSGEMAEIDQLDEHHYLLGFTPDELPAELKLPPAQPWAHSL